MYVLLKNFEKTYACALPDAMLTFLYDHQAYDYLDSSYEGGSGILKVVVGDAGMTAVAANNNRIGIKTESLVFTCAKDNFRTLHPYPRSSDPVVGICTDAFNNDSTS